MKVFKYLAVLFIGSSFGSAFGVPTLDPLWLYKDLDPGERYYNSLLLYDTCRSMSINRIYPVNDGNGIEGEYINFNYQFSNDSMKLTDPFDPGTVIYADYRPGYAGFKFDWDNGVTGFPLAKYKYLVISHKGPLPNHKVTIRFGYNSGCGTPTTFQTIGTFAASATWTTDSIRIPDELRNIPESEIKNRNYYEMQVLITNVNAADGPTSPQGNLQIDNIALVDTSKVAPPLDNEEKKGMCGAGTALAFVPPILFKVATSRRRRKQRCDTTSP